MADRWWEVTIDKWVVEMDQEVPSTTHARVQAPNAQMAMRHFVDLVTNNGRVRKIVVEEVEESPS